MLSAQGGGSNQVAGRVVERLNGQGYGLFLATPHAPSFGNAAAHLHQAVEAASFAPWAGPAIGIQADVHQPRCDGAAHVGTETQAFQGIGPIAVDQNVGAGEQRLETLATCRLAQVQPRALLAQGDFRHHAGLIPVRRVDAQYLGTEAGEQSGGDRAGQYTGQIQHPQAGQRAFAIDLDVQGGSGHQLDIAQHERLASHGDALRVLFPGIP